MVAPEETWHAGEGETYNHLTCLSRIDDRMSRRRVSYVNSHAQCKELPGNRSETLDRIRYGRMLTFLRRVEDLQDPLQ